nr:MAG TPA_asm: hypothetical protein [Caudoviricetes sp.]
MDISSPWYLLSYLIHLYYSTILAKNQWVCYN